PFIPLASHPGSPANIWAPAVRVSSASVPTFLRPICSLPLRSAREKRSKRALGARAMVPPRVDWWTTRGVNGVGVNGVGGLGPRPARSSSPAGSGAAQAKPLMRLLSLAREQENMWAQLVTSSSAMEGQLQALRQEHEMLKLESQALRRCLDRAGLLPAQDLEQELRHAGAALEADEVRPPTPGAGGASQLALAAKQRSAALAELEREMQPTQLPHPQPVREMREVASRTPSRTPSAPSPVRPRDRRAVSPRNSRTECSERGSWTQLDRGASPRRPVLMGGRRSERMEDSPEDDDGQTLNQVLEAFEGKDEQRAMRNLQRLLKAPDPMGRWEGPGGPLIAVARLGRCDLVRLLLRGRANVNDADAKGVTALHIAVFEGNMELCKTLLLARADVEATDRHGQTPLFFAPAKEICRLLVERRADVGALNRKGQTPLHLAGRAGFHEVLSWLSARAGKVAELRDHHGNTARMYGQQALAAGTGSGAPSAAGSARAAAPDPRDPRDPPDPPVPLPSQSALVNGTAQEFKLFQEPEEYALSVLNTPEPSPAPCPLKDGRLVTAADALEAAAQVASAAISAAAAAMAPQEPVTAPELEAEVNEDQRIHKLDEVLDECW
ncbi:unnamed protein product, partial [Effrenium voratum]